MPIDTAVIKKSSNTAISLVLCMMILTILPLFFLIHLFFFFFPFFLPKVKRETTRKKKEKKKRKMNERETTTAHCRTSQLGMATFRWLFSFLGFVPSSSLFRIAQLFLVTRSNCCCCCCRFVECRAARHRRPRERQTLESDSRASKPPCPVNHRHRARKSRRMVIFTST